ncbi:MAG: hypothetical protein KAG94_06260 [Clostridiales bacterium]|nr:hypothetical protein [Clostridiales bacterium]
MENNIDIIRDEYEKLLSEAKSKILRIFKFVGFVLLVIFVGFGILYSGENIFSPIFIIIIGLFILVTLTYFIVLQHYSNKKLFYQYFYKAITEDVSKTLKIQLEYESPIKGNEYSRKNGLFTEIATYKTRYRISYNNKNNGQITIYDSNIVTHTGKTTVVHFDGDYYVLEHSEDNAFQLRSNGSPKLKGMRFEKVKTRQDIKEYIKKFENASIKKKYYDVFDYIKRQYPKKKVYISCVANEIHIAIWRPIVFKKLNQITDEKYNLLKQNIIKRVELANKIYEIIN